MRRRFLTGLALIALLSTSIIASFRATSAGAPAVAVAAARKITLGDVIPIHSGPPPEPACPLCQLRRRLHDSGAVDLVAQDAAIAREQQAGRLPAVLPDALDELTKNQKRIYADALRSVPLDLSKCSDALLEEMRDVVAKHGEAENRREVFASLDRYYERAKEIEIAKGVSNPTLIRAETRNGGVGFVDPKDNEWLDLGDALAAFRKRKETDDARDAWQKLVPRWRAITGESRLFDVRHLDDQSFRELVVNVQEIEPAIGSLSYRFDGGFNGSRERLKGLIAAKGIDIRADERSLLKIPHGKTVVDLFGPQREWEIEGPKSGRVIRFLLAHNDKDANFINDLINEALRGEWKGKHCVLLFCANFRDPAAIKKLMELRKVLLTANGGKDAAASLLMPSAIVHPAAVALAALALKDDPSLLDGGGTPRQLVQRAMLRAAEVLEECQGADDQLKEIQYRFDNPKAAKFFKPGEQLDSQAIDETIEQLRSDWRLFIQFVMIHHRLEQIGCAA